MLTRDICGYSGCCDLYAMSLFHKGPATAHVTHIQFSHNLEKPYLVEPVVGPGGGRLPDLQRGHH
jgi:hypothetical protein